MPWVGLVKLIQTKRCEDILYVHAWLYCLSVPVCSSMFHTCRNTPCKLVKSMGSCGQTIHVCSGVQVSTGVIHRVILHSYHGLLINQFEPGCAHVTEASSRIQNTLFVHVSIHLISRDKNQQNLFVSVPVCFYSKVHLR